MYLSDRQRREIGIIPRIIWAVVVQPSALQSDDAAEIERLRNAIDKVCMEPLQGLEPKRAAKIANQIDRLACDVVETDLEGQPNAKVVAICWHVLAHLVETGALEIHEGTPMAEAAEILEPAFAHIYASTYQSRSIDKQARRLLDKLQREGLWTAAPAIGVMEAA